MRTERPTRYALPVALGAALMVLALPSLGAVAGEEDYGEDGTSESRRGADGSPGSSGVSVEGGPGSPGPPGAPGRIITPAPPTSAPRPSPEGSAPAPASEAPSPTATPGAVAREGAETAARSTSTGVLALVGAGILAAAGLALWTWRRGPAR